MVPRPGRILLLALVVLASIAISLSLLVFIGIPRGLHAHVLWLFSSREYKREVLSSPHAVTEFRHAEWRGDGWGGTPVGDWTGYVVYDPSDALPITNRNNPPMRIAGIPCQVVEVRRLERNWFSVVTSENQFWDSMHPKC